MNIIRHHPARNAYPGQPPARAALAWRAAYRLCARACTLAGVVAAMLMPTAASAQSSSYLRQCRMATPPGKLVFNVPGTLPIDRNLPKGTVIGTYYATPTGSHFTWTCDDSETNLSDLMDLQVFLPSFNGPADDDIVPIPNTHLGIKLVGTKFLGPYSGGALFTGTQHFEQAAITRDSTTSQQVYKGSAMALQIIAMGPVQSGETISGGVIGSVQATRVEDIDQPGTSLKFFDIELGNTITFALETCTVGNPTVELGTHNLVDGVGTVTPEAYFTVSLMGCPLIPIYYRIDPNTSVMPGSTTVMALDSTSGAAGVGIQILTMDGLPLVLGSKVPHIWDDTGVGNSEIWLAARYVQMAPRVTHGTANASATVTVLYE